MNDLNSVLLEGHAHGDVEMNDGIATFRIVSYHEDADGKAGEIFNVTASGRLALMCSDLLKHGRNLRIIGTLRGTTGQTTIVAQHMEFKPAKRSEP